MPPIKYDLGEIPDAPFGLDDGCSKVDFLFVIDNSGSMFTSQTNLVSNFPTFIAGIQSTLEDVLSYHVGVVTTDAYTPNVAGCNALGGMVVRTVGGGSDASNAVCGPFSDGFNFMTEADDLDAAFTCAARVGTDGSAIELPMDALQVVMGGSLATAECNDGFLRDDALLVIVVITDEADGPEDFETHSMGLPIDWYNGVVAAKGGIPENAALLSLIDPDAGTSLTTFTQLFGKNGFQADIATPDYGPFFGQAIGIVENACDNFIPPG